MPEQEAVKEGQANDVLLDQKDLDKLMESSGAGGASPAPVAPGDLPVLEPGGAAGQAGSIDLLMDVDLEVKIELGRTQMTIEDILKLRKGAVVELDKLAGDPIDILINDKLVARGEILVVNDNFCVRVTQIVDPEAGLKAEPKDE
jgi:flagellar motor switch protein FliN/FliY